MSRKEGENMEDGLIYEHDLHDVLEIQQALLTFVKEHEEMIKSHYTLSVDYHFEDDLKTISDIQKLKEQTEIRQKLYCIYMNHINRLQNDLIIEKFATMIGLTRLLVNYPQLFDRKPVELFNLAAIYNETRDRDLYITESFLLSSEEYHKVLEDNAEYLLPFSSDVSKLNWHKETIEDDYEADFMKKSNGILH